MSLFNVFDIAGSGMSASTVRLNTTANNLSNAQVAASSADKVYKEKQPVFASVMKQTLDGMEQQVGGVKVTGVVDINKPALKEYHPGHPMADKDGFIYKPNVNQVDAMSNMISASKSYEMNVQMLQTIKSLAQATLKVGQ